VTQKKTILGGIVFEIGNKRMTTPIITGGLTGTATEIIGSASGFLKNQV